MIPQYFTNCPRCDTDAAYSFRNCSHCLLGIYHEDEYGWYSESQTTFNSMQFRVGKYYLSVGEHSTRIRHHPASDITPRMSVVIARSLSAKITEEDIDRLMLLI